MNESQLQGRAIAQAQATDRKHSIPYRPQYNLITGQVTATILLQQIGYWWHITGRKPFYKFRAPCEHEKYREGDSWTEEIGMTIYEFDGALKTIGTKITKGVSKTEALASSLVIYWTDSDRVTWYQLNEDLFYAAVYCAYNAPQLLESTPLPNLLGKLEKSAYLDKLEKSAYLDKREKPVYIPSETTTETTTETTSKQQQQAQKPESSHPDQEGWTDEDHEALNTILESWVSEFGKMTTRQVELMIELWNEYEELEIHEYAWNEMVKAKEKRGVRPNLAYYAKCLATEARCNWVPAEGDNGNGKVR